MFAWIVPNTNMVSVCWNLMAFLGATCAQQTATRGRRDGFSSSEKFDKGFWLVFHG